MITGILTVTIGILLAVGILYGAEILLDKHQTGEWKFRW